MAVAFGKKPALHDEAPADDETTPDSVMVMEGIRARSSQAAHAPPTTTRPDASSAPPSTTVAQSAPARMQRAPPLDLHGSDMNGEARPLRPSRGDPRGRGDRGDRGDRGGECTDAAGPAAAALTPRAPADSGAWAAAVAEAEAEAKAEFMGLVPGGARDDPEASRLSSGELSHEMLLTLMRMQDTFEAALTLTPTPTPTLTLTLTLTLQDTHEAARDRRRVRATDDDDNSPGAFPPPPPPPAQSETASAYWAAEAGEQSPRSAESRRSAELSSMEVAA